METSHPDIFAVGECVEHNGICYGLVAPLSSRAKVLAATITGNKGPMYTGTVQAAKLKIMGVDVFSAGAWADAEGTEPVRFEDPALGVYKKLVLRDGQLAGVILVGDTSDSHRYMDWLRSNDRPDGSAPPPAVSAAGGDAGLDIAQMAESATICGCVGVTKGHDHRRDPRQGRQHAVAAEGSDAREHRLRQLHVALPGHPSRRRAGVRRRRQESAVRLRAVLAGKPARDPAQPAAEIRAGGARHLRQRPGLRGLQAGAQLHGRHDLVRRSRRGPLGALHQRSRARQHSEGRHVLGGSAHARRRDDAGRAAPHRRRRRQVQSADGQDHRQPAHRSARRQEGGPAESVGRPRHAVRPGLHEGRPHGEDLRRHRVLPLRHAGLHERRASSWNGASRISSRRTK